MYKTVIISILFVVKIVHLTIVNVNLNSIIAVYMTIYLLALDNP